MEMGERQCCVCETTTGVISVTDHPDYHDGDYCGECNPYQKYPVGPVMTAAERTLLDLAQQAPHYVEDLDYLLSQLEDGVDESSRAFQLWLNDLAAVVARACKEPNDKPSGSG